MPTVFFVFGGPNSPPYLRHRSHCENSSTFERGSQSEERELNGGSFLNCEMCKARASSGVRY